MINHADVIVDLQQGDCGKGVVSNELIKQHNYSHVVRYNGSNNAGHSFYVNDKKVVTHSIPAGVLHGVKSIIGPGCVLNVDHFFEEVKQLEDLGIDSSLIKIAKNTHIITRDHLLEDELDNKIGTTKRGNGPAYRDKYDRKGVRASEIRELRSYLIDIYEEFFNKDNTCSILFEGAQGFYLDIDWGDYPYVTSSHCTVGSAVMNGVPPNKIRKIYGVAKIYETYVGSKKFEPNDPIFDKIREIGNEFGSTTGRPRQCNWLNLDNLIKAIRINGVTDLVIRKVDILSELNVFKLIHNNKEINLTSEQNMKEYISGHLDNEVVQIYWANNPYSIGDAHY